MPRSGKMLVADTFRPIGQPPRRAAMLVIIVFYSNILPLQGNGDKGG
jgi:hypothetical protein